MTPRQIESTRKKIKSIRAALFDKYFGREIVPIKKYEYSNLDIPEFAAYFNYSAQNDKLFDFSEWLIAFENSDRFQDIKNRFIQINKKLHDNNDHKTHRALLAECWEIEKT